MCPCSVMCNNNTKGSSRASGTDYHLSPGAHEFVLCDTNQRLLNWYWWFFGKHATLRKKIKNWLTRDQDNVSVLGNMSTRGLLLGKQANHYIPHTVKKVNVVNIRSCVTITRRVPVVHQEQITISLPEHMSSCCVICSLYLRWYIFFFSVVHNNLVNKYAICFSISDSKSYQFYSKRSQR
jgi:hypothetical protein